MLWHTAGPEAYASMHFPSEPARKQTVQGQGERRAGLDGCALLAHLDLVFQTWFLSLADSPEERPVFSGTGHHVAPVPRPLELPRVVSGQEAEELSGLSLVVVDTITQPRAPSTRHTYV